MIRPGQLAARQRAGILALCSEAYGHDFSPYWPPLRGAAHLLGYFRGELAAHVAWIERPLRVGVGRQQLRAAYVEALATAPRHQGQGLASGLLRALPWHWPHHELAALSPSDTAFYRRLAWQSWRGPLYGLRAGQRVPTPRGEVMVLRLPRSPRGLDLGDELEVDWRPGEVW